MTMPRYAIVLTTHADWEVHRAGCSDVERMQRRYQTNAVDVVETETPEAAVALWLDDELRDMGYDESAFRIMPCSKPNKPTTERTTMSATKKSTAKMAGKPAAKKTAKTATRTAKQPKATETAPAPAPAPSAKKTRAKKGEGKGPRWSIGLFRSNKHEGRLSACYVTIEGVPMPYERKRVGEQKILFHKQYTDMKYSEARAQLTKDAAKAGVK